MSMLQGLPLRPRKGPRRGKATPSARAQWMLAAILVSGVGVPGSSTRAGDLDLPLLWTTNLKTFTESGPTVADLDGDGLAEVLVAGREEIIALGGNGEVRWRWRTRGRYTTYPAVLPREGQSSLIYAADGSKLFTCLDGTGKPVWQAELDATVSWSAPAVCDLEADGTPEVVQVDESGSVWAFEALTGKVVWKTPVRGMPASPAVGDLDGDGDAEVVVVTGKGLAVSLNADGTLRWEREIGGISPTWATSAPVIFTGSDGRGRVVAASNAGQVFCFDAKGEILWRRPTRGPVASTISVGDLDVDGQADVLLITQLGVIYRFTEKGALLWDIDMQGRSLAAGSIIDINGDHHLEYVLCTQNGHLMALNRDGESIFDRQFDNRTINVTPAFGDVTSDSPGLEMLITGGESGKTFCFGTKAPTAGLAQWTAYRGNEQKTAAWFGLSANKDARMVPANLAWDQVLTGEDIRFVITLPWPHEAPLTATAVCVRPDGARLVATSRVLGRTGQLHMPLNAFVGGTYRFSWTLKDPDDREMLSGTRQIDLEPFANDRALAANAITALRASANSVDPVLSSSAAGLRREAKRLDENAAELGSLQKAVPASDKVELAAILERTQSLTARAKRALGVAKVVEGALTLGAGTSVIVFEGTRWESRGVDRQLPVQATNSLKITRRVVPGEHEPIALGLFNVMDRDLQVRVLVDVPADGPTATPHRSVSVVTSLGETSWDPLPELDESAVMTVSSLASRELWLDVDAGGVQPGQHTVKVRLQALNGAGVIEGPRSPQAVPPPEAAVEIALDVLPFEMAPSEAFHLCAWASLDGPSIEDLLAHGGNVFIGPHASVQYDDQGTLTGFDYTAHDAFVAQFSGNKVFLLLSGIPGLRDEFGSAAYARDLEIYLEDLVRHMASNGFDTNGFALCPTDEPGGHGWDAVNRFVEFGKMVRAASPNVMIYVNGGGEEPMFQAMAPYVDIWCPGVMQLAEDSPEMDIMRSTGKMLWSYDCGYGYARPTGSNTKNINIVGQFRTAALFAYRQKAVGMGYWCYNIGADIWGRTRQEYSLVYKGRTRPVISRRWEAVREGIEDFRIVSALRRRLEATDGARLADDVRARVKNLLETRLPEMIDKSFIEVSLGLGRSVLDASNNDGTIDAFRKEMMDCVQAVAAARPE